MKKLTLVIAALAMVVGLSQCKKDEETPNNDNTILITLNANYGSNRTSFDPSTGSFAWSSTQVEYINVGGSKTGYLGQLTNEGHEGTGTFTGDITTPDDGEKLYFFYLGKGDHASASTIDISNQDGTLANVTQYHIAISDAVTYSGQDSYSATLNMKTAIAYFNTSAFPEESVYLHGDEVYTTLGVRYSQGDIAPANKGYINTGNAANGVYVALIPSTESETTLEFESNSMTGGEITFLRGIKPGYYYSNGDEALTVSSPTDETDDAIKGLFSVSDGGKMVRFSKGNLQFTRVSTDVDWSTGSWSFMTNQYDVIETSDVSVDYASETAIGLFGWGTSGWMARESEVNYYYKPNQTNGSNGSYYGPTNSSSSLTGNYANGDWGVYNGENITNGGGYTTWRVLTSNEWNYLLNSRSTSTRYAKATVGTKRGILLFPDDYTHPSGATALSQINGTSNNWPSYSTTDLQLMEANGAVFLPAAGYRSKDSNNQCVKLENSGTTGDCYYWTSTSSSSTSAYRMVIGNYAITYNNGGFRYLGCAVRLVRE